MRLLVDTNVFLELLLAQSRADEARKLLENSEGHDLFVSDYALHSIGLLLLRRRKTDVFRQFLSDVFVKAGATMLSLTAGDLDAVIDAAADFNLDFDDAYQYTTAEKHGLTIVSFDSDFDRTGRGRKSPTQIP